MNASVDSCGYPWLLHGLMAEGGIREPEGVRHSMTFPKFRGGYSGGSVVAKTTPSRAPSTLRQCSARASSDQDAAGGVICGGGAQLGDGGDAVFAPEMKWVPTAYIQAAAGVSARQICTLRRV